MDVEASLGRVRVTCAGQVVADHERCWADRVTVTDPKHVAIAKQLRAAYAADRAARDQPRTHADGQVVQLRALPDYDRLYGLDSLDGVDGVAWVTGTVDEP